MKMSGLQNSLALFAKEALILLGLLVIFLGLFWPYLLLHYYYYFYINVNFLSNMMKLFESLPSSSSSRIIMTIQFLHLYGIIAHPIYLCFTRRLFLPLRTVLSPLLMIILRTERMRLANNPNKDGGPTWYRDTKLDAIRAIGGMTEEERDYWRRVLVPSSERVSETSTKNRHLTSQDRIYQKLTILYVKQLPKHARRDILKKISRNFYPRCISSTSHYGEYSLTWGDFKMIYLGEERKVLSELAKKKAKDSINNMGEDKRKEETTTSTEAKKNIIYPSTDDRKEVIDGDNSNSSDSNVIKNKQNSNKCHKSNISISITLKIIDEFIQRAMVLLLCRHASIDRYYDKHGNYCAMTFSYIVGKTSSSSYSSTNTTSNDSKENENDASNNAEYDVTTTEENVKGGAVHLSIGYFCLESERESGIWHYNFCRCMLRGFVCGLREELSLSSSSNSSFGDDVGENDNRIRYVNMGPNEDYGKRSSGAIGADIIQDVEKVYDILPVDFFRDIPLVDRRRVCREVCGTMDAPSSVDGVCGWLDTRPVVVLQ